MGETYTKEDLAGALKARAARVQRQKEIDNRMTAIAVLIKRVGSKKECRDLSNERDLLTAERIAIVDEILRFNEIIRSVSQTPRRSDGHEPGWITMPDLAERIDRVEGLVKAMLQRFDSIFGAVDEAPPTQQEIAEMEAVE